MDYYSIAVIVQSNFDDIFRYGQRQEDFNSWGSDFNNFVYKLDLADQVDNFILYPETNYQNDLLMVFTNRTLDINDDPAIDAFLADIILQKKLLDAANELIKQLNDACVSSDLCHIPDSEFLYYNRRFYGELYKGKYLGKDQQLIFSPLETIEWDNI